MLTKNDLFNSQSQKIYFSSHLALYLSSPKIYLIIPSFFSFLTHFLHIRFSKSDFSHFLLTELKSSAQNHCIFNQKLVAANLIFFLTLSVSIVLVSYGACESYQIQPFLIILQSVPVIFKQPQVKSLQIDVCKFIRLRIYQKLKQQRMKPEDNKLFEDIFTVKAIDPGNKTPFRNVSRIHMTSEYKMEMQIDIHSQLYPVTLETRLYIKTIASENTRNAYTKQQLSKIPEKDNFEYVMYGVVFELEDSGEDLVVFASFGGLIMRLKGKKVELDGFRKEGFQGRIYILIRKA